MLGATLSVKKQKKKKKKKKKKKLRAPPPFSEILDPPLEVLTVPYKCWYFDVVVVVELVV